MKTALLFAGQGAQVVGMGRDLAEAYPEARDLFAGADDALGFSLTKLMFEGPKEELDSTENAQPAVLAVGVASMMALRAEGKLPAFCCAAGLSLGEYGAHVAAGTFSAMDAVRLVRRRGELMRDAALARPGTMASVLNLDVDLIREACAEAQAEGAGVVVVANLNSPGQVVISGEVAAVARAGELCKARGAKRVLPLAVSGAFHSPLMQPARDGLAEALAEVTLDRPTVPVLANATADYVTEPEAVRESLLEQLTGAVRFDESVRRLASEGVARVIEFGPGKVLAGLVKRTEPGIACVSVGTVEAAKAFA